MKQVRSDLVCHIGGVLPLLVTVLCEGVLLALPIILLNIRLRLAGFRGIPRAENRLTLSHSLRRS